MQQPVDTTSAQRDGLRMLDVLRERLKVASRVDIAVAFVRCSGFSLVRDAFAACIARGAPVRVLTSTYLGATQPEAIDALGRFQGLDLRVFHSAAHAFHIKLYLFIGNTTECWIGSSNLTKGGLSTNLELNARVYEQSALDQLTAEFNQLWRSPNAYRLGEFDLDAYADWVRAQASIAASPDLASLANRIVPQVKANDVVGDAPSPNEIQREALQRLHELRVAGEKRAAVIAAPGIGKTFLAAFDAHAANAKSVLFVSHRLDHITQAHRTFARVFPAARLGLLHGTMKLPDCEFVFSTVASTDRLLAAGKRHFDYVVIDEFHHAAAPSYGALLGSISYNFLLGLTATPERADGLDVLRICDHNVAYEIRLVEAINRGQLLPFHYFGVNDPTVDYADIPWRNGRFDPATLEAKLAIDARVELTIKHALELGFDGPRRATVAFCAGVKHAQYMTDAFKQRGFIAECITGAIALEDREPLYKRFADISDPLEWLFVSDVLNEGVDIPAINSLLFLRPTESETIFVQQLGRGLRKTPGCEVLTVIDLVGNNKRAWLALNALHDPAAPVGPGSVTHKDGTITPPIACEIVLDDATLEVLNRLGKRATKRDQCTAAYNELAAELGQRPYPYHLRNRSDMPELRDFLNAFGTWVGVRRQLDDEYQWERSLTESDPLYRLLKAVESDWQQPRVYAYALVWALAGRPTEVNDAYEAFFKRFPRWSVEKKPLHETKVWLTLEKKLGNLLNSGQLVAEVFRTLDSASVQQEVEWRLRAHLDRDYENRHNGVLRQPADLRIHTRYSRPQIVNYFGQAYDPARHNFGILRFDTATDAGGGTHFVVITKLDTSGAKADYQYANRFADASTFLWQSQNKNTRETDPIASMSRAPQNNTLVHLFVAPASHQAAVYVGTATIREMEGDSPVNVVFGLDAALSAGLVGEFLGG